MVKLCVSAKHLIAIHGSFNSERKQNTEESNSQCDQLFFFIIILVHTKDIIFISVRAYTIADANLDKKLYRVIRFKISEWFLLVEF